MLHALDMSTVLTAAGLLGLSAWVMPKGPSPFSKDEGETS
jgi:hypothetical protein